MNIQISNIIPNGKNPRISLSARDLVESITTDGLQEKLVVCEQKDKFLLLRGHRRLAAIEILRTENPTRFDELFKDGVPCHNMGKLSKSEQYLTMVDHGNTRSLVGHAEVYLACSLLFETGLSERDVCSKMASLLNTATPLKSAKALSSIRDLTQSLDNATKEGDQTKVVEVSKALSQRVFDARRGQLQLYNQLRKLPKVVEACFWLRWTGDVKKGFVKEDLIVNLTALQVSKLHTAFLNDVSRGATKTKIDETSEFYRLFASFKVGKKDTPTPKALPISKILEPLQSGQIESSKIADVLNYIAGDKSLTVETVMTIDKIVAIVDECQSSAPELWRSCQDHYEKVLVERQKAIL